MESLITGDFLLRTMFEFVELRDIACARITLFNARRDGEPARLSLAEWNTGYNRDWFNSSRLASMPDEERQHYISDSTLMYQSGKGATRLVPVIVPPDIFAALKNLGGTEVRRSCGVSDGNV